MENEYNNRPILFTVDICFVQVKHFQESPFNLNSDTV